MFDPVSTFTEPRSSAKTATTLSPPPRTPKALVERISAEMKAVLETPEVVEKMRQAGVQPAWRSPADFGAFANSESAVWGKVISDRGIKPE